MSEQWTPAKGRISAYLTREDKARLIERARVSDRTVSNMVAVLVARALDLIDEEESA